MECRLFFQAVLVSWALVSCKPDARAESPELLYQGIEDNLLGSKTISMEVEVKSDLLVVWSGRARLLLGDNNRVNVRLLIDQPSRKVEYTILSNGKRFIATQQVDPPGGAIIERYEGDSPPSLRADILRGALRLGILPGVTLGINRLSLRKKDSFDKKAVELINWTERFQQGDECVITCEVSGAFRRLPILTFTLDTTSMLPKSRLLKGVAVDGSLNDRTFFSEERYTNVVLNADIPESVFSLR